MPAVYLGIDIGTTVLKAGAFDAASGKMIAFASCRLRTHAGNDGSREQSAKALGKALDCVLAELRSALKSSWKKVEGIGLASQGGSVVICNRVTGRPLTPLILWNDNRYQAYMQKLLDARPKTYWQELSMRIPPGAGLGKMLWFREHSPGLINGENIYSGAGEFLFHALTGVWRQDAGNAVQMGCYDVPHERISSEPLKIVGMDLSFVPPMRKGHETVPLKGAAVERYGLPGGIPCAGPYIDQEAGYMSSAAASQNPLQCSLGTAWVGNFIMPKSMKWSSPIQIVIPSPVSNGWLVIQPLLTGNVSWDWGLQELISGGRKTVYEKCAGILKEDLLPPKGLVCIPFLAQKSMLGTGTFGSGILIGLNPRTTRADMLRAVATGLCFEFHRVFKNAFAERLFDAIVLSGGVSKLVSFQTYFAALFDPVPVLLSLDQDGIGARGTLYAFDKRIAETKTLAVKKPAGGIIREIRNRYIEYETVFDAVLGDAEIAGPLTFGRRSK